MIHPSWEILLTNAYAALDEEYKLFLEEDKEYFPTKAFYFNAFKTLAKQDVKYILFGQDPYPREQSAGGYAFIDMKVETLFCATGLSKEVNKATSLRNFMKMALVANKMLSSKDTSQQAIVKLDKSTLINSINELRINFEKNGVLLLNTALIFTNKKSSKQHIKAWRPFMKVLLEGLREQAPKLILLGNDAHDLKKHFDLSHFESIVLEHPYNTSFINNPNTLKLFAPMRLLER